MLRESLIFLRKQFNTNFKKFAQLLVLSLVILVSAAVCLDVFLPFSGLANFLRAIVLIPLAITFFSIGYVFSLVAHRKKVSEDPEWIPYRLRFSPNWRRRISAIVAAVLFVFIYGTKFQADYTILSSLFAAVALGLVAFMRTTKEEMVREDLNIPDSRDIKYTKRLSDLSKERAKKLKEKKDKKPSLLKKEPE